MSPKVSASLVLELGPMKPVLVWLVLSPRERWQSWTDSICCLVHTLCHKCIHLVCELMIVTHVQG